VAAFPLGRPPRLPAHMKTHLVGAGSSLNPQGAPALPGSCSASFSLRLIDLRIGSR
jgi:hypothetical protein